MTPPIGNLFRPAAYPASDPLGQEKLTMTLIKDEEALARFAAALDVCADAEALIRPFSRRLDAVLDEPAFKSREVRRYDPFIPGVYFAFDALAATTDSGEEGRPLVSPVRIAGTMLPTELAAHYGHETCLSIERVPDVPVTWLTMEIGEDASLAPCLESVEVLLRGRAQPKALGFHVGLIANFRDGSHQVIGPVQARFGAGYSSFLHSFAVRESLNQPGEEVTALKLALFLPTDQLAVLELCDLRCLGNFG